MKFDSLINLAKDGVSKFRTTTDEIELVFLISEIKKYNRRADFDLLERCYEYSKNQHEEQRRKSKEPYLVHCVETAKTLIALKMDMRTICAGLLHDTIEDTEVTRDELAELFDSQIADLVEGVTTIGTIHFQENSEERQAENYRKMLFAMAKDVRVIIIKLADRLHNMRTLEYLNTEKQREIASETLEIYAPLAHRLGMAQIKCELEDLSFKYLNPEEYKKIDKQVSEIRAEREKYIATMAGKICYVLKKKELNPVVFGRAKHLYSIYRKIHQKGVLFKDICDLIAFRILVNSVGECYVALGALHEKWKHLPERVKDYIGPLAKTNGYQSLHTTILDKGRPVEIQIRTHDMHQVAEKGIAAHWRYKEGAPAKSKNDQPFVWFREFVEHIQEVKDPDQFLQSMKEDLFPDEVYVFTPKGDVIALPVGSTPVDFAYKIHTDIGNTCIGAEINGRIAPLRYQLQNGDLVRILTNKHATPSRDWLNFVKTGRARNKVRRWLREQERNQSLEIGKQLLEAEFRRRHIDPKPQMKSEDLLIIAEALELHSIEDLLEQIGYGDVSAQHMVNLMFPPEEEQEEEIDSEELQEDKTGQAISIAGIDQAFARIAKCCNPIPGDDVIGFLTRGRGVSIHRVNCNKIMNEPERIVQVTWNPTENITYPVEIWIESNDRKGLLGDISTAIAKEDVNILKGNFWPKNYTTAYLRMVVGVTGIQQINRVFIAIEKVRGVRKVMRKGDNKSR